MFQARHILENQAQFQFDADSYPCNSSNCRPTSEAMIAGFYRDIHISPASMRRAMGYSSCGGTDTAHAVIGLEKYGVPASRGQLTKASLLNKLAQNIPVDLAVVYGKIPRDKKYIQDFSFYGAHSVVACKRALIGGTYGLWIRDPDRWGTGKVEKVFWPDHVWYPAWQALNYISVWPNKTKVASVVLSTNYRLYIEANATVMMVTSLTGGCIAGWSTRKWGSAASSAPALAPVVRRGCVSGSATTAYVTAGVFKGKHIRIGDGITIKEE